MELKVTLLANEPLARAILLAAGAGEEVGQDHLGQRVLWMTEMKYLFPKYQLRRCGEFEQRRLIISRDNIIQPCGLGLELGLGLGLGLGLVMGLGLGLGLGLGGS